MSILKEKDSALYFLCQNIEKNKAYELIRKIITKYKMDDEILTELIKELYNKLSTNNDYKSKILNLIYIASDVLNDATNLIDYFINNKNDLMFLLIMIEKRIIKSSRKEDLKSFANILFSNNNFNEIIKQNLDINIIIKIMLFSKDNNLTKMFEQILYSENVNLLEINNLKNSIIFLSENQNITYENIIDKLVLNHITNMSLLIKFKSDLINSKNKDVQIKGGVVDIYDNLYSNISNTKKSNKIYINDRAEEILTKYDSTVLKSFVDGLSSTYINKTHNTNSSLDIMSMMLNIDQKERADDIFIKSSYRPIDKVKRKLELASHNNLISDFSLRLNANINICLNKGYYDLLFTIISAKKIDSININVLYRILIEMTYAINEYTDEEAKICQSILDMIIMKVSAEKLFIYRTNRLCYDYARDNKHILSKDKVLDFINTVIINPDKGINEILSETKESWIAPQK